MVYLAFSSDIVNFVSLLHQFYFTMFFFQNNGNVCYENVQRKTFLITETMFLWKRDALHRIQLNSNRKRTPKRNKQNSFYLATYILIDIGYVSLIVLHAVFFYNSGMWWFVFELIECVTSLYSANIDRTCKYTVRHFWMIILYT